MRVVLGLGGTELRANGTRIKTKVQASGFLVGEDSLVHTFKLTESDLRGI